MKQELIAVTGAGGFIGGALIAEFRRQGYTKLRAIDIKPLDEWYLHFDDVENLCLDLNLKDNCDRAAAGAGQIYNLAANMGGMGFIESNKALCMLSVLINTHMLQAAKQQGARRFFYASSACVYNGDKQRDPNNPGLKEEDAYPALAEDGYGWEKLYAERVCRHYTEDFGLDTRVVRFHNIFGPLGTYDGGREKSPAAICRKIAMADSVDSIEVWGDGNQTRSYCYVDDCVEGIFRLMQSNFNQPLNLGQDRMISINELVDMVAHIAGKKIGRIHDVSKPQGVRGRNSDNSLLRKVLGWEPSITLEEGLAKTYFWIHEQLEAKGSMAHSMTVAS